MCYKVSIFSASEESHLYLYDHMTLKNVRIVKNGAKMIENASVKEKYSNKI